MPTPTAKRRGGGGGGGRGGGGGGGRPEGGVGGTGGGNAITATTTSTPTVRVSPPPSPTPPPPSPPPSLHALITQWQHGVLGGHPPSAPGTSSGDAGSGHEGGKGSVVGAVPTADDALHTDLLVSALFVQQEALQAQLTDLAAMVQGELRSLRSAVAERGREAGATTVADAVAAQVEAAVQRATAALAQQVRAALDDRATASMAALAAAAGEAVRKEAAAGHDRTIAEVAHAITALSTRVDALQGGMQSLARAHTERVTAAPMAMAPAAPSPWLDDVTSRLDAVQGRLDRLGADLSAGLDRMGKQVAEARGEGVAHQQASTDALSRLADAMHARMDEVQAVMLSEQRDAESRLQGAMKTTRDEVLARMDAFDGGGSQATGRVSAQVEEVARQLGDKLEQVVKAVGEGEAGLVARVDAMEVKLVEAVGRDAAATRTELRDEAVRSDGRTVQAVDGALTRMLQAVQAVPDAVTAALTPTLARQHGDVLDEVRKVPVAVSDLLARSMVAAPAATTVEESTATKMVMDPLEAGFAKVDANMKRMDALMAELARREDVDRVHARVAALSSDQEASHGRLEKGVASIVTASERLVADVVGLANKDDVAALQRCMESVQRTVQSVTHDLPTRADLVDAVQPLAVLSTSLPTMLEPLATRADVSATTDALPAALGVALAPVQEAVGKVAADVASALGEAQRGWAEGMESHGREVAIGQRALLDGQRSLVDAVASAVGAVTSCVEREHVATRTHIDSAVKGGADHVVSTVQQVGHTVLDGVLPVVAGVKSHLGEAVAAVHGSVTAGQEGDAQRAQALSATMSAVKDELMAAVSLSQVKLMEHTSIASGGVVEAVDKATSHHLQPLLEAASAIDASLQALRGVVEADATTTTAMLRGVEEGVAGVAGTVWGHIHPVTTQLHDAMGALSTHLDHVSANVDKGVADVTAVATRLDGWSPVLEALSTSAESTGATLTTMQATMHAASADLAAIRPVILGDDTFAGLPRLHVAVAEGREAMLTGLHTLSDALPSHVAAAVQSVITTPLQADQRALHDVVTTMQGGVASLSSEVVGVADRLDGLREQIVSAVLLGLQDAKGSIDSHHDTLISLQAVMASLTPQFHALSKAVGGLEAEMKELSTRQVGSGADAMAAHTHRPLDAVATSHGAAATDTAERTSAMEVRGVACPSATPPHARPLPSPLPWWVQELATSLTGLRRSSDATMLKLRTMEDAIRSTLDALVAGVRDCKTGVRDVGALVTGFTKAREQEVKEIKNQLHPLTAMIRNLSDRVHSAATSHTIPHHRLNASTISDVGASSTSAASTAFLSPGIRPIPTLSASPSSPGLFAGAGGGPASPGGGATAGDEGVVSRPNTRVVDVATPPPPPPPPSAASAQSLLDRPPSTDITPGLRTRTPSVPGRRGATSPTRTSGTGRGYAHASSLPMPVVTEKTARQREAEARHIERTKQPLRAKAWAEAQRNPWLAPVRTMSTDGSFLHSADGGSGEYDGVPLGGGGYGGEGGGDGYSAGDHSMGPSGEEGDGSHSVSRHDAGALTPRMAGGRPPRSARRHRHGGGEGLTPREREALHRLKHRAGLAGTSGGVSGATTPRSMEGEGDDAGLAGQAGVAEHHRTASAPRQRYGGGADHAGSLHSPPPAARSATAFDSDERRRRAHGRHHTPHTPTGHGPGPEDSMARYEQALRMAHISMAPSPIIPPRTASAARQRGVEGDEAPGSDVEYGVNRHLHHSYYRYADMAMTEPMRRASMASDGGGVDHAAAAAAAAAVAAMAHGDGGGNDGDDEGGGDVRGGRSSRRGSLGAGGGGSPPDAGRSGRRRSSVERLLASGPGYDESAVDVDALAAVRQVEEDLSASMMGE